MYKHIYTTLQPAISSPAVSKTAKALKKAQEHVDTIRPIVTAVQLSVLVRRNFKRAAEYKRVGSDSVCYPAEIKYLSTEDSQAFAFECLTELYFIHGIKSEFCPLLHAELKLHQTKVAFLDSIKEFTRLTAKQIFKIGPDHANKVIESWLNPKK